MRRVASQIDRVVRRAGSRHPRSRRLTVQARAASLYLVYRNYAEVARRLGISRQAAYQAVLRGSVNLSMRNPAGLVVNIASMAWGHRAMPNSAPEPNHSTESSCTPCS